MHRVHSFLGFVRHQQPMLHPVPAASSHQIICQHMSKSPSERLYLSLLLLRFHSVLSNEFANCMWQHLAPIIQNPLDLVTQSSALPVHV